MSILSSAMCLSIFMSFSMLASLSIFMSWAACTAGRKARLEPRLRMRAAALMVLFMVGLQ
ncbi:hypothetical protein D3C72_2377220 [compost metagenome]